MTLLPDMRDAAIVPRHVADRSWADRRADYRPGRL